MGTGCWTNCCIGPLNPNKDPVGCTQTANRYRPTSKASFPTISLFPPTVKRQADRGVPHDPPDPFILVGGDLGLHVVRWPYPRASSGKSAHQTAYPAAVICPLRSPWVMFIHSRPL